MVDFDISNQILTVIVWSNDSVALKEVKQKGNFGQKVTIRRKSRAILSRGPGISSAVGLSGRSLIQVTITPASAPGAALINWL